MITEKLQFDHSTKNTHVYKCADSLAVPVLYIKKKALPADPPALIEITIKF
jgi:hypothetical protein